MSSEKPIRVLFVCLGNICRSPLAEAVFRHLVAEAGLSDRIVTASCGTGSWHVGSPAHHETRRVGLQNGISIEAHRARQLCSNDLTDFDFIIAMDRQNRSDIERYQGTAQVRYLREFEPEADSLDVPDPYFGGPEGFDEVFRIIERSCRNLLAELVSISAKNPS